MKRNIKVMLIPVAVNYKTTTRGYSDKNIRKLKNYLKKKHDVKPISSSYTKFRGEPSDYTKNVQR